MNEWYLLNADEVIRRLETTHEGLDSKKIPELQEKYGRNVLEEARRRSKFTILLRQFKDIMIIILLIAAAISFFLGEYTDGFVVLAIIIANAWIGYVQENKAEEAVMMLKKMAAQYATVLRNNKPVKIETPEVVPGDIILIEAGDIVPADARLIKVSSLKTEEAALTGESQSVEKITEPINEKSILPADQRNMVFKGTLVSNGSARAVVTTTGMNTEFGKIAGLLEKEDQKTPLQKRMSVFSRQLSVIVILICLIVFGYGLARGESPYLMFLTALSLAVAALPEALPAVITIALAIGAKRMVKKNALIRKLPAVETLGSVTYICSDKTGTLTQNKMTVEKEEAVEGKKELLHYAMLLNNEVRFPEDGDMLGDSTEVALVNYSLQKGKSKVEGDEQFKLEEKLPFDSDRMRMGTFHKHKDNWILFVKGAPTKIAEALSEKYKDQVEGWLQQNRNWAAEGLRVLFFAYREFDSRPGKITEDLEKDLDFLGMVAMIDPPREEVIESIRECKSAGIKTVMITGDQPLTASAIATRLEIGGKEEAKTRTGAELAKLDPEAFKKEVNNVFVYARVSPEQKLNIVNGLQENGEYVAMTGDGVNDAPSIKQADIGIAMGITGTEVAKEASDMILLDDNFATIVKAVKEGRRIYENIRKFILYVLSCNLAEILTIFFAPVLGLPIPLLPIHILWINLVTDGLPGLALTAERAEKDIMQRPPRPPRENIFGGGMIPRIVATGTFMAMAVLFTQSWASGKGFNVVTQQTIVFTLLCFIQLANAFSVRSSYQSIFSYSIFSNPNMWSAILGTVILQLCLIYIPFLNPIFNTTALNWDEMKIILIVTAGSILGIEGIKYLSFRRTRIT